MDSKGVAFWKGWGSNKGVRVSEGCQGSQRGLGVLEGMRG